MLWSLSDTVEKSSGKYLEQIVLHHLPSLGEVVSTSFSCIFLFYTYTFGNINEDPIVGLTVFFSSVVLLLQNWWRASLSWQCYFRLPILHIFQWALQNNLIQMAYSKLHLSQANKALSGTLILRSTHKVIGSSTLCTQRALSICTFQSGLRHVCGLSVLIAFFEI